MSALPFLLLTAFLSLAPTVQVPDSLGDGGPAVDAILVAPDGVAVDAGGNIYVTERAGHRVRRVDAATGIISTLAGTGEAGYSGDGGLATRARIALPTGLAVDAGGNLYIAEPGNHRIRRVDLGTGVITTVAGNGERGFSGDGGPATEASLNAPFGVTVGGDGDIYISDTDNYRIRRVDRRTGVIRTVAGDGRRNFAGDGGLATEASLARPHRVAVSAGGDLFIGDSFNFRIRRVDVRTGVIRTIAGTGRMGSGGDGGPAAEASMTYSGGLALDRRGGLVVTDLASHRIRRIDLETGIITRIAGSGRWSFGGDDGSALEADVHLPSDIVATPAGDLLFADQWNGRVRRIRFSDGTISTVAGSRLTPPTPEVSYHFHYDAEAVLEELDAPVVGDPGAGFEGRTLDAPVAGTERTVRVELFVPSSSHDPAPFVVLLHGRASNEFEPAERGGIRSWGRLLAARGFVAAVVTHRLGNMPRSLEAAAGDVSAAMEALRKDGRAGDLDPTRGCLVSFEGGSTLLAPWVRNPPPFVRCMVAFHPHLALEPPALWDWYLETPEVREAHSLPSVIGPASPPLLVAVGAGDRVAVVGPAEELVELARDRGARVEVMWHPVGGAHFERLRHDQESRSIVERTLDFLERSLQGR